MKTLLAFPLLLLVLLVSRSAALSPGLNDRPIVGVLTMPTTASVLAPFGKSYLVASYVKWIEGCGARVAVVPYNADRDTLWSLFTSINGLLFTGGGLSLGANTTYFRTAQTLFGWALDANDKGDFFPVWGTCQGFQLLSVLGAGSNHSVLLDNAFDSENLALPLDLTPAAASSRLLGSSIPSKILQTLTQTDATINLHRDGVSPASYHENKELAQFFALLSTNADRRGRPFGSTIEAKHYPMFATQWHPERNIFEWDTPEHVLHSPGAVAASYYVSSFFVNQTRHNHHAFASTSAEEQALIYQHAPSYTGNTKEHYPDRQTYFFSF